ncbi:MAG: lipoprotein [Segetibacter sp.]|nr:lipoprotein [Segetibacter sp.]
MYISIRFLIGCAISLFALSATAQNGFPSDTSFTTHSAFIKERKKFPFIEIAQPAYPKGVSKKLDVVYSTIGKRKLRADVFYPVAKSKATYPAVILLYGGGWKSGDKSMSVPIAEQLAANGYVAVSIEYRLSPEAQYPAAVYDVKAAIRWMRVNAKKYRVDPSKIAVHGVSAGGQLAALVGTTNGLKKFEGSGGHAEQLSAVQAIIDIDGVLAFKHPESSEGKVAAEWLGGTSEEKPSTWQEASALTHAGKSTPPILFINSSTPRFHAGRDDMIKVLNAHNIYSEVHTIPDTPHPFWLFHPWFQPTMNYTISFLDKVFKGK